ncbi:MAG: cupin domain-containing protein [Nevskiales bacterium]
MTTAGAEPETLPGGAIQHAAEQMQWQAGPAALPPGTQLMVLEGDPKGAGLFTLRLKVPAGTRLPPHTHPRDERVTVLSGRVGVGFGERFDDKALRFFDAGSYYLNPAELPHFVLFPIESVVQITGIGPWQMRPVATAKP